jgi:tartrate-resistant acid phosphatase type 5
MKRVLALALLAAALLGACTSRQAPSPKSAAEIEALQCDPPPTLTRIDGPQKESLRLVALGDAGLAPDEPESKLGPTLAGIRAVGETDAILLLGDNVYDCGASSLDAPEWTTVIAPLLAFGKPVYPVLGNHDWGSRALGKRRCDLSTPMVEIEKSGTTGFEQWIFPAPNYVVDTPSAEIILFDSTPIAQNWPQEGQRSLCALRSALSQTKTKPWRIVVAHHPLYSCGEHGDQRETVRIRQAVEGLLQQSGVDLYVTGHDHDLEIRSEPAAPPVYLISGSGSKTRPGDCKPSPTFQVVGGFAVLEVTAESLTLNVYCNGQEEPCMTRSLSRG